MGYRSDVAICLQKEKYNEAPFNIRKGLGYADKVYETKNGLVFYYESIKWYNHNDPIKLLQEYILNNDGGILIVGEDDNDNVNLGNTYDYNICIKRYIDLENIHESSDQFKDYITFSDLLSLESENLAIKIDSAKEGTCLLYSYDGDYYMVSIDNTVEKIELYDWEDFKNDRF
jgi:hypothetical protein